MLETLTAALTYSSYILNSISFGNIPVGNKDEMMLVNRVIKHVPNQVMYMSSIPNCVLLCSSPTLVSRTLTGRKLGEETLLSPGRIFSLS